MEEVRPCCGQPSDRGRLKNRTAQLTSHLLMDRLAHVQPVLHTHTSSTYISTLEQTIQQTANFTAVAQPALSSKLQMNIQSQLWSKQPARVQGMWQGSQ